MPPKPTSVRLDDSVLKRVTDYVTAHPGVSISGAINTLLDEALRSNQHPLVHFVDGPAGRRARIAGGADVWEIISAVRSARSEEPSLPGDELLEFVVEATGTPLHLTKAAIAYWSQHPTEVDAWIERNAAETAQLEAQWAREQGLLNA
jgi:antitoxin component of RelBE/YafQ-DinJ toxin-antitoxin module